MIVLRYLFLLMVLPGILLAQEWNQWRGAERNGYVTDFQPPENWPDSLQLKWETPVGEGYGSPVVRGNTAITLTRVDGREVISATSLASGELLWQYSYDAPFKTNQYALRFGKGPFSTPLVHTDLVYTLGIGGTLTCLSMKGSLLWQKFLHESAPNVGTFFVGIAMSPLIYENLLIVHIGDETSGRMIAFDRKSGEEVWSWSGDRPAYASPILAKVDGQLQLITQSQTKYIGINPAKGTLLWQFSFESEWRENIVTPLLIENVLIASGVKRGTTAWRITKSSSGDIPEKGWHSDKFSMYMSSPLIIDETLFGFSHLDKGQFFAANPQTGEPYWIGPGRNGQNAALVTDGQFIYAVLVSGEMLVIRPSRDAFDVVARYTVSDRNVWAHPILHNNRILIKDAENLRLWQISGRNRLGEKVND